MFSDNMPGFTYDHRQTGQDAIDKLKKAEVFKNLYKQEVLTNQMLVKEINRLHEKYLEQEKELVKWKALTQ
jgi:hypothetical protein